ncbi:MAG: type II toxin-antitoxin system RelE/ParE family toxin [Alphaproteobacteria bacterium]|nr:type II toxin-antitoxin system RelE/ParE family toxin [Alphaproteobacteria bacterium]
MAWQINVEDTAIFDLAKLDRVTQTRIDAFINKKLPDHPNIYAISEPMKGKFQGKRRFRVGDYRILAEIDDESKTITIYQIGHRSHIYNN